MTKHPRINLTILAWVLCTFAALFSTCKEDQPAVYTPPPVVDQQANFFLSWLAECTSDTAVVTSDSLAGLRVLTQLAAARTTAAITDTVLINAYGSYGTAPAWGPALSISTPGDTVAITDNMLYTVRSESDEEVIYSIGVAGTNAISFFDWFAEDFNVAQVVPWTAPDGTQHGSISAGSQTGLEILTSLADETGTTILDFIQQELGNSTSDKTYKIVVTGHSLGGALSPLLALYLKERLTTSGSDVTLKVEGWPYAGPTPGDQTFATYLVETLDAYHAFNNNYDVVPHVWELDSLDRLCNIYAAQPTVCDSSLQGQVLVQAFAQWAIGQSTASGINYHIAGQPNTFDGPPLTLSSGMCDTIQLVPFILGSEDTTLFRILIDIVEQCGSSDQAVSAALENFAIYFLDLGFQHTDAYELEFFPSAEVAEHVNSYTGQASLAEDLPYIEPILGELILDIYAFLRKESITDCACPN